MTLQKTSKGKIETTEVKFLWNAARYISKQQIRNTLIRNELLFNLNNIFIIQNNTFQLVQNVERKEPERSQGKLIVYKLGI